MTDEIKIRVDNLLTSITTNKNIDDATKAQYTQMLTKSASATNGETETQKIQALTENMFDVVCLMINQSLTNKDVKSGLYGMIIECKWAIVTIAGFIMVILTLHPELSSVIDHLIK